MACMGLTFLKARVSNPQHPRKARTCEFLVDSGAVYSVAPTPLLKRLGIRATSHEDFTLANGEIVTRPVGNALFEFRGKLRASPIVFGEKDVYLLGATTLESWGVILDPLRRELKPLPMLMMSHRQNGMRRMRRAD